jgi:glycosyltransferase involved in cell wall biosynthesis
MLARLKRSGARIVEVSHEFEPRDTPNPLGAALERVLAGHADSTVDLRLFLGVSVRDRYATLHPRIPRSQMQVIPHGDGEMFELLAGDAAALTPRLELDERDEAVLFFGNLRPSKGVEDLVEAFARASRPPQSRLLIVGYPSPEVDVGALRERATGLGIGDLVRFDIGYLPNELVAPLFRLARFVALPYRSATQSGPLHIAFTFAKPVLATRTGGIIDVVEDGVTGLLVEPGNVLELSAGLERLMWDDLLVDRMAQAVEVKRGEFRWAEVAAQVLDATARIRTGDG